MTSTISRNSKWKMTYFEILVALSQVFGFSMIILSAYLFNTMGSGIVWIQASNPYNFHGFFMVTGLIFFQGEALLSYRLYRFEAKLLSKFVHVVFHALAIGFFITALVEVIKQKNVNQNQHFATVHSWIGVAVMMIYLVQFAFGFINFLIPGISLRTKQAFMPFHRAIGCISMCTCTIQAVIGHTQYVSFAAHGSFGCYYFLNCKSKLDFVYNFSVITLVLYAITVLVIVIPPPWRRQKTLDEMK